MKCLSVNSQSHSRIFGILAAAALGVAAQSASAQCPNYVTSTGSGSIVAGTTNIGNACDDCGTVVSLPFSFSFYGTAYTSVEPTSNGYLLFNTGDAGGIYNENTYCVPYNGFTGAVMMPCWTDGWTSTPAAGIFTSTSGSAPNRIFNIEWRGAYYPGGTGNNNFEVRLYEAGGRFDFVYGTASNYWNAAVGIQNAGGSQSVSVQCNAPMPAAGTAISFTCPSSGPPTGNLAFSPNSGPVGSTFLATSVVTPGYNPPSTGITVVLNASGINSGNVSMHDDGLNGDAVAGDGTYSANVTVGAGASIGSHSLPVTFHDAQNRTSTGAANFTVSGANDDCGGAIPAVIGNNPFDNSSATTSSPAAPCGALGADLWYTFSSPTAGSMSLTTCGLTGGDSAIAIYSDCNTAIACNDDSCGLQSNLCMPIAANTTYLLRIGGFAGTIWTGSFNIAVATAGYNPPPNATPEGEDCNQIFPDSFNGGCNSTPVVYSNAEFCTNYTGTAANSTSYRDTDWWMFNLPTDDDVTVSGQANFAAQCFFVNPTCPGALVPGTPIANPGACSPDFSITFHLSAGPQVFFISPAGFDGSAVCGVNGNYWFHITLNSNPGCAPYGACCSSTGCVVNTQAGCAAAGGTYNGNGSHCSSCPATGGCCTASGCSMLTQAACGASGGSYQGDGVACPQSNYVFSNSSNSYTDISGTGTLESVTSGCDDCVSNVALPFTFNFYGNNFNDLYISSNGNIQFGATPNAAYVNDNPPTAAGPNNAIYPCWDDLYPVGGGGGIYYQTDGVAPDRRFTVAWNNIMQFGGGATETFEAILYEGSNNIELRYGSMPNDAGGGGPCGGDYTIGVENQDGTSAVTICGSDIGSGNTARMVSFVVSTCGPSCDSADFDCDGDVGTDFDIQAFFRCLAGNCPSAPCTNSADFNHDGDVGTDADIEAFFRVLAGNPC